MKTTVSFEFDTESEAAYFLANHGAPTVAAAPPAYAPAPMPPAAPYVPPQPAPMQAAAPAYAPPPPQAYAPPPPPMPAAAPRPQPAPALAGGFTVQQVTAAAQAYAKAKGARAAQAVMGQYGIKTVAQLDPAQYGNFMQSMTVA